LGLAVAKTRYGGFPVGVRTSFARLMAKRPSEVAPEYIKIDGDST